ncbi:demethoxyubiquinone hydroxylase family protein [Chitinimonas sp. BJYL2]|uniref:demethoxyubiquinone hydroxylase family protein n=1 Tax=Chitinimonas sp. BJYL2 TaxID=2976696 RepID=UPI0022B49065|nr:demethoxyubiquinone hydroxylase family protein [Chitinimonas sp. BJYL2]
MLNKSALGNRYLKVNHAGENGAVSIYSAQILIGKFTAPHLVPQLREFKVHEEMHRAVFATELRSRNHPRCKSYYLCAVGGFALGTVTALLGPSAIAATTVAVESVVLEHLHHQVTAVGHSDSAAAVVIASIIADEQKHHDQLGLHLNTGNFWPRVIHPVVAASTKAVIWLGMRL